LLLHDTVDILPSSLLRPQWLLRLTSLFETLNTSGCYLFIELFVVVTNLETY